MNGQLTIVIAADTERRFYQYFLLNRLMGKKSKNRDWSDGSREGLEDRIVAGAAGLLSLLARPCRRRFNYRWTNEKNREIADVLCQLLKLSQKTMENTNLVLCEQDNCMKNWYKKTIQPILPKIKQNQQIAPTQIFRCVLVNICTTMVRWGKTLSDQNHAQKWRNNESWTGGNGIRDWGAKKDGKRVEIQIQDYNNSMTGTEVYLFPSTHCLLIFIKSKMFNIA